MKKVAPAVRCAKGDYVKFEINGVWLVGRVVDRNDLNKMVTVKATDGRAFELGKTHLFKADVKEHDAAVMAEISKKDNERPSENPVDEETSTPRLRPNPARYTKHTGTTTSSGRVCYDIDDTVAEVLRGLNIDDTYRIVQCHLKKILGDAAPSFESLVEKHKHLNLGMQRMNLGNLLRGSMRKHGVKTLDMNIGIDCM